MYGNKVVSVAVGTSLKQSNRTIRMSVSLCKQKHVNITENQYKKIIFLASKIASKMLHLLSAIISESIFLALFEQLQSNR